MSVAIGIDLATHCGWAERVAYVGPHALWEFGTWDLSINKHADRSLRFQMFQERLAHRLILDVDHVYYELVHRHQGTLASHMYGAFQMSLITVCDAYKVPYTGIPVGTIKKYWTGNGSASKEMMVATARSRGFNVLDDNAADALAILHCGLRC